EQRPEDALGGEVLARDRGRVGARSRVVGLDGAERRGRLLDTAEGVQPGAQRQHVAEPGVLLDYRAGRGPVACRPGAEPAAAQPDVPVLGDGELAPRAAEVFAVAPGIGRDGE